MGSEGGQDSGLGLGGGRVETKREEGKGGRILEKENRTCSARGREIGVCVRAFFCLSYFFSKCHTKYPCFLPSHCSFFGRLGSIRSIFSKFRGKRDVSKKFKGSDFFL